MKSIREARKTFGIVSWIAVVVICLGFYVSPEHPIDSFEVRVAAGFIVLSLFALLAILMINLPRTPFFRQQIETMAVQIISGRLVAQAVIEAKQQLPQEIASTVRAEWEKLTKDLPAIVSGQISGLMAKKLDEISRSINEQLRQELVRMEASLIANVHEKLAERVNAEMQSHFRALYGLEEQLSKAREGRALADAKVKELKDRNTQNGHSPEHFAEAIAAARLERSEMNLIVQSVKKRIAKAKGLEASPQSITS